MAITFVNSITFTPGQTGGTSGPVDMTGSGGADLLVVVYSTGSGVAETISDSVNGATYTNLTRCSGNADSGIAYKWNAGNAANMTFTISNAGSGYPGVIVYGFNGTQKSSDPIDGEVHATATGAGTTYQPGSITPSASGDVFVTGIGDYLSVDGHTLNSSFLTPATRLDFTSSVNYECSASYKISAGSGAENPTWTTLGTAFQNGGGAMAAFKASVGGGGGAAQNLLTCLGVGS